MQVMLFIFLYVCPLSSASKDGAYNLSIALRCSDKRENVRRALTAAVRKGKAVVLLESFSKQCKSLLILLFFIVATVLKNKKKIKKTCLKVYFSGTTWNVTKAKEQLPVEIITMIKKKCS